MLKVWGRTNSINVQKVMWTVAELGIEVERVDAGMGHGILNEPWYTTYNPNRLVPTIDDDGLVLWESNVIVRYLAAKHAPGTLMPADLSVDRTRREGSADPHARPGAHTSGKSRSRPGCRQRSDCRR